MSRPVVVLVPGAWHNPSGFAPLAKHLTEHGYTVEGVSLASVGASKPMPNFDDDVSAVASSITKFADQGSDVVVLVHSYGGFPGSSACKGLLKSDRQAQGEKGGVVHLIYCAAFAIEEGVCLMDGLGGEPLPWFEFNGEGDEKSMMPMTPGETFYNDIKDKAVLDDLVRSLRPQTYGPFWSKNTYAAWKHVPSTYVVCENDEALPPQAQKDMVANARKALESTQLRG